jgi:hypothetical protein
MQSIAYQKRTQNRDQRHRNDCRRKHGESLGESFAVFFKSLFGVPQHIFSHHNTRVDKHSNRLLLVKAISQTVH